MSNPVWSVLLCSMLLAPTAACADRDASAGYVEPGADKYNLRYKGTLFLEPNSSSERGFEFVEWAEGPDEGDLAGLYTNDMERLAFGVVSCQLSPGGRLRDCLIDVMEPENPAFESLFLKLTEGMRVAPKMVRKWQAATEDVLVHFQVENEDGKRNVGRPCVSSFCIGPIPPAPMPPMPPADSVTEVQTGEYSVRYGGTALFEYSAPSVEGYERLEFVQSPNQNDLTAALAGHDVAGEIYSIVGCTLSATGTLEKCEVRSMERKKPASEPIFLELISKMRVPQPFVDKWRGMIKELSIYMTISNKDGKSASPVSD